MQIKLFNKIINNLFSYLINLNMHCFNKTTFIFLNKLFQLYIFVHSYLILYLLRVLYYVLCTVLVTGLSIVTELKINLNLKFNS